MEFRPDGCFNRIPMSRFGGRDIRGDTRGDDTCGRHGEETPQMYVRFEAIPSDIESDYQQSPGEEKFCALYS